MYAILVSLSLLPQDESGCGLTLPSRVILGGVPVSSATFQAAPQPHMGRAVVPQIRDLQCCWYMSAVENVFCIVITCPAKEDRVVMCVPLDLFCVSR